jgi:hypothetical protein
VNKNLLQIFNYWDEGDYQGYMPSNIYEMIARKLFIEKGGQPVREVPHYMVVEACKWLNSWYIDGCHVKIPDAKGLDDAFYHHQKMTNNT